MDYVFYLFRLKGRIEADDWLDVHYRGNPRSLDLVLVAKQFAKEKSLKAKPTPKPPLNNSNQGPVRELPRLVESSTDTDSDSDSDTDDSLNGDGNSFNPTPKRKPVKKDDCNMREKTEPITKSQIFKPGFLSEQAKKVEPEKPAKKAESEKKSTPPQQVNLKPGPEVARPEHPDCQEFIKVAGNGSKCYKEAIFQGAKDNFGRCLAIIDSNYEALNLSQPVKNSVEVVVIKFMYARACTGQHTYKVCVHRNDSRLLSS